LLLVSGSRETANEKQETRSQAQRSVITGFTFSHHVEIRDVAGYQMIKKSVASAPETSNQQPRRTRSSAKGKKPETRSRLAASP
jgi:hypothetical protein